MSLTVELTPEQEARLNAVARQAGIGPADVLRKLMDEHLPPLSPEEEKARREQVMQELVQETERLGLYR